MYTTPEIIATTSGWLRKDNQMYRLIREGINLRTGPGVAGTATFKVLPISEDEMLAVDLRLPSLLEEMRHRNLVLPYQENAVWGRLARMTYDEWHVPHLQLTDRKGKLHHVKTVNNLVLKSPIAKYVFFDTEVLTLGTMHTELDGQRYPLVVGATTYQFWVSLDQLHAQFPGWEKRYVMSEALDLKQRERTAFILENPRLQPDVSLGNIDFV